MQFLFENQVLDVDRRELRRGAKLIMLEPQVFDLLVYLVQKRDRVGDQGRSHRGRLGRSHCVQLETMTSRITAARKAIGDSGDEQRLIRTVPRKGVRFVGLVRGEQSVEGAKVAAVATDMMPMATNPAFMLGNRPSIAVMPFQNMSDDREQEYFADGIVEDIITALSRMRWLFVIASNSSFTYKGRVVDVKQVGRDLGVRYALEGSVRKAANRVRITGSSSMPQPARISGRTASKARSRTSSICRTKSRQASWARLHHNWSRPRSACQAQADREPRRL